MAIQDRKALRVRRHLRIRKKIEGTAARPRFCVSITANNIYCQFIDDVAGRTLASVSTLDAQFKAENGKPNMEGAALLAQLSQLTLQLHKTYYKLYKLSSSQSTARIPKKYSK